MIRLVILFVAVVFMNSFGQEYRMLGEKLFDQKCSQCHTKQSSQTTDNSQLKAPPMDVIVHQARYYYRNKESFTEYLSEYLREPSEENSVCLPCIRRWGKMPPQDLTDDEVQLIGKWLFSSFR